MRQVDIERQIAAALGGSLVAAGAIGPAARNVLRVLGGRPPGDPEALRAVARAFRQRAHELRAQTHRVDSASRHAVWEGPGADRMRARTAATVSEAHGREHQLIDLAARLDAGANDLAARQSQWDRRRWSLVREAARTLPRVAR